MEIDFSITKKIKRISNFNLPLILAVTVVDQNQTRYLIFKDILALMEKANEGIRNTNTLDLDARED